MALSPPEISLIKSLREEATEVKECFTKFSFQAIGLGVAVVGYMAVHSENLLANATGAGAVISLMLATAHIGAHKYHTANRNHGFELYLRHAAQCRSSLSESEWPDWSKPIGWEEAMRAWRVVQATFFEKLYCPRPYPNWLRGKVRIDTRKKWFEPDELVKENATYHAGSYLGTVQLFLFLLSIIALVPLISQTVETRRKSFGWETQLVLLGALFFFILYRWIWNAARRSVLERGLDPILRDHVAGCCCGSSSRTDPCER